jgi:hypothetical protein
MYVFVSDIEIYSIETSISQNIIWWKRVLLEKEKIYFWWKSAKPAPIVKNLLQRLVTLPVTTSTPERSFSTLRHLKK